MVLVALTVVVGIAIGWARGGRLRNLGTVELRAPWLAVVAVVLQVAVSLGAGGAAAATPLLLASQTAVLAFAAINWLLPGALLIGCGTLLNMAVIALNGVMPVGREALLRVGQHPLEVASPKHRLLEPGDALPWLADVIPLALLGQVISVGDIVLAAGLGLVVSVLMLRHPPPPGRRSRRSRVGAGGSPVSGDPVDGGREPVAE